jgi:hypothetical protein
MMKSVRIALVALFALFGGLSLQAVSAQMMHFNLDITIQTEDGADIPGGQVCVSGEVNPICQDIGGNPSGRDFFFSGLADGDHTVTISGADPYLDITDTVNLSQDTTSVTYTLQKEQPLPPAQTTAPALPVTGAGTMAGTPGSTTPLLMIVGMLALVCAGGSAFLFRKRR